MITVDDKLSAMYRVLNADATLRDANHLNGAGKIFAFPTRPANHSAEALTMNMFPAGIEGQQPFLETDLLRFVLYIPNASDLTPAKARAGNIESRIAALLDEVETIIAGIRYLTYREAPGRLLALPPDLPDEHAWIFQYFLRSR